MRSLNVRAWLVWVLGLIFTFVGMGSIAHAYESTPAEYRALVSRVRQKGAFRIPILQSGQFSFSYDLRLDEPIYTLPLVSDFYLDPLGLKRVRKFYDKISLNEGAVLQFNGEAIPLTCIFVEGQDNRFSEKDSPLIPDFILRVYLVANDYTCTGPINPGWPENGGRKDSWETYLYYEIRDPTIMLPVRPRIRFRGNELQAELMDTGGGT
ncbi:MAG: hypothetical protein AABZ55_07805 [Bdellovibrionota bacterium]